MRDSVMRWAPLARAALAVSLSAVVLACGGGGDKQQAGGDSAAGASAAGGGQAAAPATAAATGDQIYQRCQTCHQPNGQGIPGTYPPLAGSEYANAKNPAVPIRIVMHGLQGPITVHGQQFNGVMPQYGTGVEMSDDEVAAVLTYVRSSFGNSSPPITAAQVATERKAQRTATGPMTAEELTALMK